MSTCCRRIIPSLISKAAPGSVIGGGYVGCELGQLFARAGVRVTIVDIVPILSAGEPEISAALVGYLREEGIVLREGVTRTAIRETARGIALDILADRRSETIEAEQVLVSTGPGGPTRRGSVSRRLASHCSRTAGSRSTTICARREPASMPRAT